uniref:Major facilitator superfamily (MFS) profile domain-containing protein n=1 Tax=Amphiprion ocellaris TaxID=80972 RepID=A0AAQ5ZZ08_AMPOC
MADPYQNNIYHQGGADYPPQEEDAASDVTEGHDEEDQMYEGEYQGIPHPDEVKAAQRLHIAAGQSESDHKELSEQYEDIMEDCGHGKFQWTLFIVLGLALMADGVECFVVAFVLPSAEKDLCLSNAEKGMLGLVVFLSMMVGAFLWGGLADKVGRRRCLMVALAINCVFAFLSSFAQGYGFFLFFRLLSGIGIGGTVPIVYSYFSEFLQMDKRGEHLSWLCMFWMIGGIYASFTAWGIIPRYGWGFSMGTEFQFHSWRVFVLVAALPAIASLVGLTFMPESPRFLLENAKHDEAWMILKQVHDTNWRAKGQPEKVFTVTHIKAPKTAEDEFIEIQSATGTPVQRWAVRSLTLCKLVLRNVASLLSAELRFATLFMAIIWFCMAFSYYGLSVWFPDMIKHLQYEEYESKVKVFHGERLANFHFNFSLENQIHREGKYIRDTFVSIEMKSVKFEDSLFEDCHFKDIKSTDTVFENCTIRSTIFYNTDLWEEKFIDCRMENVTFEHNKHGCHLDTMEENDVLIYLVSFLGSLAVLPGNIISALFMEKIGRVKIIGGSMLISAGCTFFLFLSFSQSAIITLQCLFCGVSVAAWNGIEVVTVELYPASKRATAFGVLNALCKLAAVLGSSIFASFVGVTKAIPILLSFAALVCGGLVALKLPDTRQKILQ